MELFEGLFVSGAARSNFVDLNVEFRQETLVAEVGADIAGLVPDEEVLFAVESLGDLAFEATNIVRVPFAGFLNVKS